MFEGVGDLVGLCESNEIQVGFRKLGPSKKYQK